MNRRNFFKLAASVLAVLGLPKLVAAKENPCLSHEAEILTTKGWVKISEVTDNWDKYTLVQSLTGTVQCRFINEYGQERKSKNISTGDFIGV